MDIKVLLGKRIQELRKSKSLTQENLSEMVGIETSSLSNIERGKFYPTAENLNRIIQVLDVEPAELFNFQHLNSTEKLLKEMYDTLIHNEKLTQLVYKFFKLVK